MSENSTVQWTIEDTLQPQEEPESGFSTFSLLRLPCGK